MSGDSAQSLIDSLDDVLDEERSALSAGDLEQIGSLMSRKEDLVGRLNRLDAPDHAGLREVRAKAERNQALLHSALEGIRTVVDRIADLRRVRQGTETYDRHGRKARLQANRTPRLEKRA